MTVNSKPVVRLTQGPRATRRLLDAVGPLPINDQRWLNGATWNPLPCTDLTVASAEPCDPEDLGAVTQTCTTALAQSPFQVIDAWKDSHLERTLGEVDGILSDRWDTMLSATVAHELLAGTGSGGQSFAAAAVAPSAVAFGAAAVRVNKAFGALEDHLARKTPGRRGFIHIPPGLLTTAVGMCNLTIGASGLWETPNGHVVIADDGYVDATKPTDAGAGAAAAFETWIYCSGPVFFASTEKVFSGVNSEAYKIRRDEIHRYLTSYAIVAFDECPVAAVLTDYTDV